eukprot:UN05144
MYGKWGTVCNDAFNAADGRVACRQLGYSKLVGIINAQKYQNQCPHQNFKKPIDAKLKVFISHVYCKGNENHLLSCRYKKNVKNHCRHHEDAGVICSGKWRSDDEEK